MDKVKAYDNLCRISNTLKGLSYWLDLGTLMGACRENDFLDSDFDIDVGMYGEDDIHIPDITDRLKDNGFTYFHIKQHPCGEGKQISCMRHGIGCDINFYYLRDDKRFRVLFDIEPSGAVRYAVYTLPRSYIASFRTVDFIDYGREFMIPIRAEDYLACLYGNWKQDKTPQEFHWQTDYKCIDPDFEIYSKPRGRKRWLMTSSLIGKDVPERDYDSFKTYIKRGIKLYPLIVDKERNVIDGNKRLQAYKKLGVPMIECYVN